MRSRIFLLGAALAALLVLWFARSGPGSPRHAAAANGVLAGSMEEQPAGDVSLKGPKGREQRHPQETVAPAVELATVAPRPAREGGGSGRIRLLFSGMPKAPFKTTGSIGAVDLQRKGSLNALDRQYLGEKGWLEFDGLEAGSYVLVADRYASFRFDALTVELEEGGRVERAVMAEFRRRVRFRITAIRASGALAESARDSVQTCDVRGFTELPSGDEEGLRSGARTLRLGQELAMNQNLFPGPVVWEGRYRGKRGRPMVPAQMDRVVVQVPPPSPGESPDAPSPDEDTSGYVDVEVHLRFGSRSQGVGVKGVILNDPSERAGGIEVVARATTGDRDLAEVLTVREDGGFYFQAELDRLSGPQVYLRSRGHKDLLGPFVLGPQENDLGELRFMSRLTQAEADERREALERLMERHAEDDAAGRVRSRGRLLPR